MRHRRKLASLWGDVRFKYQHVPQKRTSTECAFKFLIICFYNEISLQKSFKNSILDVSLRPFEKRQHSLHVDTGA